jgi:D-threonate/D-erythronate kinase
VAARLTRWGYQPLVMVKPGVIGRLPWGRFARQDEALVVVNTRGRDSLLRLATAAARAAAASLQRHGLPVVYQKIDSTLRGHWPEELKAIAEVIRPDRVLVCPAFPAQGRFVRGGRLGIRWSRGRGIAHPPGTRAVRDIGEILKSRCGWLSKTVGLKTVRRGVGAIRSELSGQASPRCAVFDAEDDYDLQVIGRALSNLTGRLLWVGSAGLIRYVLPKLSPSVAITAPQRKSPWLLIQGSRQPTSHLQFERLRAAVGVRVLKPSGIPDGQTLQALFAKVLAGLASGNDVAVVAPKRFDADFPAPLARFWGRLVRRASAASALGGIFVTGGNTAETVCDSLRVKWLRVVAEVRPGIALSVAMNRRCPGLQFVTKAGGFGGPDEVLRVLKRCRRGFSKSEAKALGGNHPR